MTRNASFTGVLIAIFLFFFFSIKSVAAGSYSLSSLNLGSIATLNAVADATRCQNKESQMVNQFDLTALTLNDQGVMVGNAPPVIDLKDVKIESLTIAGKTITSFPVSSQSSWGYIYKIDPPISFGPNDKAVIKASNIKMVAKGKAKAWFLLTSNAKGIPCISSGTFTFSVSPIKTPTPKQEVLIVPTASTTPSVITPTTKTGPQTVAKTPLVSTFLSQIKNFILSLFGVK